MSRESSPKSPQKNIKKIRNFAFDNSYLFNNKIITFIPRFIQLFSKKRNIIKLVNRNGDDIIINNYRVYFFFARRYSYHAGRCRKSLRAYKKKKKWRFSARIGEKYSVPGSDYYCTAQELVASLGVPWPAPGNRWILERRRRPAGDKSRPDNNSRGGFQILFRIALRGPTETCIVTLLRVLRVSDVLFKWVYMAFFFF